MAKTVTLTIDGKEVTVPEGTVVIEAAKKAGIEIPFFCYHPKLDPLGACRMCMVEFETPRGNRMMTACTVVASDGMVVHTDTEKVAEFRKANLAFLLANHPLDCPICDKGGECPLQDTTYKYGDPHSQYVEPKRHKAKHKPISPVIMLDQERCILCWRCLRYLDEWEDNQELGRFQRGGDTCIDVFPGTELKSKTSGNIIDLCPVGALTSRVSRFHYRPWELERTPSICTHCSLGCNLRIDVRTHEVRRIVARSNEFVNDEWLCDKGRFAFKYVNSPDRLLQPLVRKDGNLEPATWDEALSLVAEKLDSIASKKGGKAVGGIGSARLSNEANYLFQRLFRTRLRSNNLDYRDGADVAALPTGIPSIQDARKADVVFLLGLDPDEQAPVFNLFLKRGVRRNGATIVLANPRRTELNRYNGPWLRYRPGTEVTLLNGLTLALVKAMKTAGKPSKQADRVKEWVSGYTPEKVQRITGVTPDALRSAAEALVSGEKPLVLYGPQVARGERSKAVLAALGNIAMLLGGPERLGYFGLDANVQGARDVGLHPALLPGQRPLDDDGARRRLKQIWGEDVPKEPGMSYGQMLRAAAKGQISAMYVMGADPASESPAYKSALEKLDFLVVQDMFLTETAKLADVVLPASSYMEGSGTFTNIERRVQMAPEALKPLGQSLPDWMILLHLANRWPHQEETTKKGRRKSGPKEWRYHHPNDIFVEITRVVPMYEGFDRDIVLEGVQWSFRALESPVRLQQVEFGEPVPSEEFPLRLFADHLLYDGGTLFRSSDGVQELMVEPFAAVSPETASRFGVTEGEKVEVASPSGSLILPLKLDDGLAPDTVFVPYSVPGAPVETLLDGDGFAFVRLEKHG